MTDTERDLIRRMANELDLYRQMARDDCTSTHPFADEARALLAQPEPVPVSADTAFAIGQTGGPPSEVERLAFEAWMRGHSWLVSGKWNGTTYADPQERHGSIDLLAMQTRMLWAAWRDRAALARWGRPAVEPVSVSERPILKSGNFNDANGHCWCGTRASIDRTGDLPVEMPSSWELREPCAQDDCVLPHHALPFPTTTETP